ncbi:MAG: peptide deformylase [Lachnospiraceae bacterium]|nr:peptide deformylase [Lachnospiraceae bacterium]
MAILNIRQLGDECLKKKCKPIKVITPRIRQLAEDMLDTMYEAEGVGLAAPQVGILKRLVVIDTTPYPEDGEPDPDSVQRYVMINPEILETSGEQRGYEGCLSYTGMSGIVTRPSFVKVAFTDLEGYRCELSAEGLLARAVCHECDHLDGVMYTERTEGPVITNEELDRILEEKEQEKETGDS